MMSFTQECTPGENKVIDLSTVYFTLRFPSTQSIIKVILTDNKYTSVPLSLPGIILGTLTLYL